MTVSGSARIFADGCLEAISNWYGASLTITGGTIEGGSLYTISFQNTSSPGFVLNQSGGTVLGFIRLDTNSTYNLTGGSVTNTNGSAIQIIGVFNQSGGTVESYATGGNIEKCAIEIYEGTYTLSGTGKVKQTNPDAYAIAAIKGGTFNFKGGTITNTGSGVYLDSKVLCICQEEQ